nr:glycosyltransferase [Polynucleobacter sp. MWH-HuK1]
MIPTLSGGGAERQLSLLAKEQARCGWNVHIGIRRGGVHLDALKSEKIEIHQLRDFKSIDPRLFVCVCALLKKINPDIVQTWLPQMDVVGGTAALVNRVKWIGTERSSIQGINDTRFMAWLRWWFFRYADAVVANSSAGESYWRRVLPANKHIFQVANAVDVDAIRNAPQALLDSLASNVCENNILVVGRLAPEKGIDVVINAVKTDSLSNLVGAWVIGEGPSRQCIENMIGNLGMNDRVSLSLYRSDWWGLLRRAAALVSMSRFEGQPNVVLEAMAAGCPVIVSDIPAHREILNDESAIFVQPDDHLALAKAIESVVMQRDIARQRSELAYGRVSGMTIQSAAREYENIYRQVLTGVNE